MTGNPNFSPQLSNYSRVKQYGLATGQSVSGWIPNPTRPALLRIGLRKLTKTGQVKHQLSADESTWMGTLTLKVQLKRSERRPMVFSHPGQAAQIWQQFQRYWEHYNRPAGQRFLGSLRIPRQEAERLLDIVCDSFARIRPFTFAQLNERFGFVDLQQHWIRITTLALSEYAYYDRRTGFWQGICDRLDLQNTTTVQNTLRRVVRQGASQLGLVVVKDQQNPARIRCVSTLWLQSGIPQQNLNHFAHLVQEISQEYGWWEISHAEPTDLSQLMYDVCVYRHPQWGRLLAFLKASRPKEGVTVEPISGQLLQGISIVAMEVERRGQSASILLDGNQREQWLQRYSLPNNFFLRSWDNLVQVLTPQQRNYPTRGSIVGVRKKPLVLALDIDDSMDIQLCLPEQTLWRSEWNTLRGTYCQIQECRWEATLPYSEGLQVPLLTQVVNRVCEQWTWRLQSHNGTSLTEWHCEGISQNFPILIFDAWTGDRLPIGNSLTGNTEIICFVASSTQVELSDGIELLDGFVPCSIESWRGQQLYLTASEAWLTFRFSGSVQSLQWSQYQTEYPQLRGLKLRGRQPIYLGVPEIWHPPCQMNRASNILIEDLIHREILTPPDETVTIAACSGWQSISLSQWITRSGTYAVRLWNQDNCWSEQFEVRSDSELGQSLNGGFVEVCTRSQTSVETPIQADSSAEFWLSELTLHGLWPLEEITLLLTNGEATQRYRRQASASGILTINLAAWRDVLPDSNWYTLNYQRQGEVPQRLLEMVSGSRLVSYTWADQAIHLSGLYSGQAYTLILWNVLTPQNQSLRRTILASSDQDAIAVPLSDLWGLFHVELEGSNGAIQSLGWWSGIQTITNLLLPDELIDDSFEYCVNIFDNQSVETFSAEVGQLDLDIDVNGVQAAILSLRNDPCHLPDWLDQDLLHQKLQVLLEPPNQIAPIEPENNHPQPPPEIIPSDEGQGTSPQRGRWYLVTVQRNNNSQSIFSRELRRGDSNHLIRRCETPLHDEYQQYVLIETIDLSSEILELVRQTPCFQRIERRPLPLDQVIQMLGRNPDVF